jgi:hypothetical protein
MKRFENRMRIEVSDEKHPCFQKCGEVVRIRISDSGAWVDMDEDLPPDLMSFTNNDPRRNHMLLYPEQCKKENT